MRTLILLLLVLPVVFAVPSSVTDLSATRAGDRIVLSWTASLSEGQPVDGYFFRYSASASDIQSWGGAQSLPGNCPQITGVSSGTQSCSVSAADIGDISSQWYFRLTPYVVQEGENVFAPSLSNVASVASSAELLAGDVLNRGVIDVQTLSFVVSRLGARQSEPDFDARADLNGDGVIDVLDVVAVARDFGRTFSAVTLTFTATQTTVLFGESVTLDWSSQNADSCTASGAWSGPQSLQGSQVITPQTTGVYTLTCEGQQQVTRHITIAVVDQLDTLPPEPQHIIFQEDFEAGHLNQFVDGRQDPYTIITDPSRAFEGQRYLQYQHPPGVGDPGHMSAFYMPGYDEVFFRYRLYFEEDWLGSGKLVGLYGSRTDNQWSSFGRANQCAQGDDFFNAIMVMGEVGVSHPGFYLYHADMDQTPGCYGDVNIAGTWYDESFVFQRGQWYTVTFLVRLNEPGIPDGLMRLWVDDALVGEWQDIRFRTTPELRLNVVMLQASGSVQQVSTARIDDIIVARP